MRAHVRHLGFIVILVAITRVATAQSTQVALTSGRYFEFKCCFTGGPVVLVAPDGIRVRPVPCRVGSAVIASMKGFPPRILFAALFGLAALSVGWVRLQLGRT